MTDNVRKVFDILGVEPNEEFKIILGGIPSSLKCKIDDKLQGYYLMFNRWELFDELIRDLLNGTIEVIKLPKESKKKKLRDLTEKELDKWANKNCNNTSCDICIFRNVYCMSDNGCWIHHKDLYTDKFLDQEIEVEE